MDQGLRDIVAVLSAIIGLSIIAFLVQSQNTSSVISSASTGFSNILGTAMGNVHG